LTSNPAAEIQNDINTKALSATVVLPFDVSRFREFSVTDRPGDWGLVFDRIVTEVDRAGNLVVLESSGDEDAAITAANHRILIEAESLAGPDMQTTLVALIVWDGVSRGPDDKTAAFADEARDRGWQVAELSTRSE
jgi:hypothetical protein